MFKKEHHKKGQLFIILTAYSKTKIKISLAIFYAKE